MRPLAPSLLALSFLFVAPEPATAGGGRGRASAKPTAPRIKRLATPVAMKLESLAKMPQLAVKPDASKPPALTPEQLAVDTITLDATRLGSPQIGMVLNGIVSGHPTAGMQGFLLPTKNSLELYVQVPWVGTHLLQVECTGSGIEAMKVGYGRWSIGISVGEGLGNMTIDHVGDASVSFSIAGENHAPWEYLIISLTDADGTGTAAVFDQCTFKRF